MGHHARQPQGRGFLSHAVARPSSTAKAEREGGVCAREAGGERGRRRPSPSGGEARLVSPRRESPAGSQKQSRAHGVSPLFTISHCSTSLSVLSPSIPPLPLCPPFSCLGLLVTALPSPQSPARTPQRSAPWGCRPCAPPPGPRPSPALPAPGLTQKSRLKPSSSEGPPPLPEMLGHAPCRRTSPGGYRSIGEEGASAKNPGPL
ncbi:WAS/WASL-interacting protein family member 3-like [Loxodonta africana]|uniref:WAS/WASL-interacting protein family member 3-like n=1 Tax=Loxodonta africana TaxID=9785 RepID=UPI0030D59B50